MTTEVWIGMLIAVSYVLGSVPTGLWLGLALRGQDIRKFGSGNIGATNTFRALGKGMGITALVCDMAKGLGPVVVALLLFASEYVAMGCGLAAILGHSFSIFLKFRGGKGVATSAGVFLGLIPVATLIAAGVFLLVFWRTRMVSLGSVLAAAALGVAVFLLPLIPGVAISWPMRMLAALVAVLVIVKHRTNIKRVLAGEEHKF